MARSKSVMYLQSRLACPPHAFVGDRTVIHCYTHVDLWRSIAMLDHNARVVSQPPNSSSKMTQVRRHRPVVGRELSLHSSVSAR